jgi:hypothetical protein
MWVRMGEGLNCGSGVRCATKMFWGWGVEAVRDGEGEDGFASYGVQMGWLEEVGGLCWGNVGGGGFV